ncbi:universal stress protein [Clonorchis sinensis]|uniref:Universal stress protein n=1 Tax=Clonorchis sinensis TaxID=79923 RepID=G7YR44_CLOSI|nr:universal stress protein [Clonorchis sinensis]
MFKRVATRLGSSRKASVKMEGTIDKSGSEVSRKICIPLNPKHDLRQIFHWYGEHIRHENDSLLFVSIIKPQFTMPVLVGTAIEIPRTNVKRAKELCREAMQLAKKHGLKANSYIYVSTNQQKTLTQCLRELQPDLVLVEKREKNTVLRKITGDCQVRAVMASQNCVLIVLPPLT